MTESIDRATVDEATTNIIDSGSQMSKLISNLLDFTRTRLGQSLAVKAEEIDLAQGLSQNGCRTRSGTP